MRMLSILVLFSLSLGACSRSGDANNPIQPSTYSKSTRATRLADEFSVRCENSVCPEGTGVLFISTYSTSGLCTAWVAGEHQGKSVLITNKHCVYDVQNCSDSVAYRIAATGESASCERILKVSEFSLTDPQTNGIAIVPDYAIILLDRRLSSAPLRMSQQGLEPKSSIIIRKAWTQGSRSVAMREEACKTGTDSFLVPDYKSATSPNISLFDCAIKEGVSGSPVFNSSGEVAAIVQIGPKEDASSFLSAQPLFSSSEFSASRLSVATNLSCITSLELGLSKAEGSCQVDQAAAKREIIPKVSKREAATTMVGDILKFHVMPESRYFGWASRQDDSRRVRFSTLLGPDTLRLELAPRCIMVEVGDLDRLRERRFSGQAVVEITSPGWAFELRIDKYGKFSYRNAPGFKTSSFTFDPGAVAKLKEGETLAVIERVGSWSTTHRLPPCPKGDYETMMQLNETLKRALDTGDNQTIQEILKD